MKNSKFAKTRGVLEGMIATAGHTAGTITSAACGLARRSADRAIAALYVIIIRMIKGAEKVSVRASGQKNEKRMFNQKGKKMKPETKRKLNARIAALGISAATLAFAASCDNGNDSGSSTPPPPTVSIYDKTINVKGAASISGAKFNTAKAKLQGGLDYLGPNITNGQKNELIKILERDGFAIIIETGAAAPAANADKSMTIGIDYLLANENDAYAIAYAIFLKVFSERAFSKATARETIRLAKMPLDPKAFAADAGVPGTLFRGSEGVTGAKLCKNGNKSA